MAKVDLKKSFEELKERFENLKEALKPEKLREKLKELESQMENSNFWRNRERSKEVLRERKDLEQTLKSFEGLQKRIKDLEESINEPELQELVEEELKEVEKLLKELEIRTFLTGEVDKNSAYLTVQAGAGGTEACDWAQMLLRMYMRWAESKNFKVEVIDLTPDERAGIKSATLLIEGDYAYGYLKGEQGVHRLVRISPFDANARRHTSFASVSVLPKLDESIKVEIREEDLKIETFRASGAGGQYVNKTDTAVRITHIPTGIVVSCQQERSQYQNKRKALELLKAKLYQLERKKLEEEKKKYEGEKKEIGWGNQIRSYILEPYKLVKDLRTQHESYEPEKVLEGDLDDFIYSYLRWLNTKESK